ncbi:hypothetical protein [Aquamicrobium sp.]|uniref:hypothetical protein n=1 Tax=Aquamicrobium sp. TaxID=1872579 RepID=UPI00349E5D14
MKTSGRTDRNGGADDSRDDLPDLGMGPPMRNGPALRQGSHAAARLTGLSLDRKE